MAFDWLRRRSSDPNSGEAIRAAHAITEIWSLGHASRATSSDYNRRVILLQAAAWIPEFRDALVARKAVSMERPGLDALDTEVTNVPSNLNDLLASGSSEMARSYLEPYPEQAPGLIDRFRARVASKWVKYHQFKYAVALEDEIAASHPNWTAHLLAPAMGYLPTQRSAVACLEKGSSLDALGCSTIRSPRKVPGPFAMVISKRFANGQAILH